MAGAVTGRLAVPGGHARRLEANLATRDSAWVKWPVISLALAFFALFLVLPLVAVFVEAFRKGAAVYFAALTEPDAVAALKLTLTAAAIAVPLNLVFGVAAAWAVAKHDFTGKQLLTTLIDLPFSVSPVIAGLMSSVPTAKSVFEIAFASTEEASLISLVSSGTGILGKSSPFSPVSRYFPLSLVISMERLES